MKMNKTDIETFHSTANPATGCNHGCEYCYARAATRRYWEKWGYPENNPFQPLFHPLRLTGGPKSEGKPKSVFLCSMGDLGGKWNYMIWDPKGEAKGKRFLSGMFFEHGDNIPAIRVLQEILLHVKKSVHTYYVLTKNPQNLRHMLADIAKLMDLPGNLRIGTTVNDQRDWGGYAITPQDKWDGRSYDLMRMSRELGLFTFLSYEPALGPLSLKTGYDFVPDWMWIGAQTGIHKAQPHPDWVNDVVAECKSNNVDCFVKSNITLDGVDQRPKQLPELWAKQSGGNDGI